MKLGFFSFFAIGFAVAVIILSYTWFWTYVPDMEDAQAQEDYAVQLQTEAKKLPQAAVRRQHAADLVNDTVRKWQAVVATRTVPGSIAAGGINMAVNAWQMTIDVRLFRNSIQRAVNKQVKAGGIKVINAPLIPFPGTEAAGIVSEYFNYPAIPFPVVIFDLGQITVQGTYPQIKANMAAWSHMPNYLAVADGLALTGTAPILTATYNVTIVGYIHGTVVYPTVREAAAPSGTAPAAGGGGGGTGRPTGGPPIGGGGPPVGGGGPPAGGGGGGAVGVRRPNTAGAG
jgi:hypothetical protein